ncbi:hypothetical protein L1049_017030 [Liquidambar formosana]|uniref:Uncharacterized protein n=1 Tax=Liquidambar formosana TaxID=63359 RepID=A0AAP0S6L0_LIQFO
MQVEEVKRLLEMVPMWTTFLVYRLVEATGSTFFIEQTNNLIIPKIGDSSYTIIVSLFVLRSFSCFIISYLYELLILKRWTKAKRRHAVLVRIGVGMACSILCCIAACLVEVHRLKLIKKKNLQNDTDEPISMSVFWLVPQFFLIGLMEGLAEDGLDDFFSDQVTESMARYGPPINECALGIGKFLNVLCVFVFRSWFSQTINFSRLDKYYTMLGALSLGNLCFYCIVSTCVFAQTKPKE